MEEAYLCGPQALRRLLFIAVPLTVQDSTTFMPRSYHPRTSPTTPRTMPPNNLSSSLKSEVSKLARLSNVQAGLPPLMRGLPVLAILAGEAISKATGSPNAIEARMLGADETFMLGGPSEKAPIMVVGGGEECVRQGVRMMCGTCGMGKRSNGACVNIQGLWTKRLYGGYMDRDGLGRLGTVQSIEGMQPHGIWLGRDPASL